MKLGYLFTNNNKQPGCQLDEKTKGCMNAISANIDLQQVSVTHMIIYVYVL